MFIVCCRKCELKVLHNVQSAFGQWITNYLHIDYTNKDFFGRHQGEDSIKSELRQIPVVQIPIAQKISWIQTRFMLFVKYKLLFLYCKIYGFHRIQETLLLLTAQCTALRQTCLHEYLITFQQHNLVACFYLKIQFIIFLLLHQSGTRSSMQLGIFLGYYN